MGIAGGGGDGRIIKKPQLRSGCEWISLLETNLRGEGIYDPRN